MPLYASGMVITTTGGDDEQYPVSGLGKNMKAPKIPPLNLPQTSGENVGTLTRSTRRADPFKSFSTNSNRFSNSIDSGFKD